MNGATYLASLPAQTRELAIGFAQFLASQDPARMDSVAHLEAPLSPIESMIQRDGARYDSKALKADAMEFVARALGTRHDAAFTAMFARQLEYIYTETFDIEYPELKARQLIPVDTRVPTGANSYTYSQFDLAAKAAIVHNYARNSFPESDVFGNQFNQFIQSIGSKYSFSVQDMRAAAMAGIPLEAKKAAAARYAIEKRLEQIAAYGDVATGLIGITTAPNINVGTKVSPAGTWAQQIAAAIIANTLTTTVQAILEDVNFLANQIFTNTIETHTGSTLVLPTQAYAVLATTPRAPGFTDDTILQYILKSSPWLDEIVSWPYLNTIGVYTLPGTFDAVHASATVTASTSQTGYLVAGDQITFTQDTSGAVYTVLSVAATTVTLTAAYSGTTHAASPATIATGLALMYDKTPDVLSLVIPQEFEQFPPVQDGLEWEVMCHMRCGGVNVIRPLAVASLSGISAVGAAF
jgi:hypothetical protein